MSIFRYPIDVGDTALTRFEQIEAWVDTGASHTLIPYPVLERLGYSPVFKRSFRLADGNVIERDLCRVHLRIDGEVQFSLCVFGEQENEPLLGVTALEEFALGINPTEHTLVPVVGKLLGLRELSPTEEMTEKGVAARSASRKLAKLSSEVKDSALLNIADALLTGQEDILQANERDCAAGKANGLTEALLDRLLLDPQRLESIASDVRRVAALPDPVGEVFDMRTLSNGLVAGKKRVPLGVIGVIYESRPNVTVDVSILCLKSGNACILRGGSEAIHSNAALAALIRRAIADAGVPEDAVQFINNTDRSLVEPMVKMRGYIDLLIPRGSQDLIQYVTEHAVMPVLAGGIGVCHTLRGHFRGRAKGRRHCIQRQGPAAHGLQRLGHAAGTFRGGSWLPAPHRSSLGGGRRRAALRPAGPQHSGSRSRGQGSAGQRRGLGQGVSVPCGGGEGGGLVG